LNRLAVRVSDLNLPKASLPSSERVSYSFGYWVDRHLDVERKLNLRAQIDKTQGQSDKLRDLRGLLTPLLRDTLSGLLYAYYAPLARRSFTPTRCSSAATISTGSNP